MNEQRLQEIKERADRATTGPWFCSWSTFEEFAKVNIEGFCITDELDDFDAEFIAYAREDVPALVAEIERLQNTIALHEVNKRNLDAMIEHKDAEIERLRKALEFYADKSNYNRIMLSILTPKVLFDDGEIARKALAGE